MIRLQKRQAPALYQQIYQQLKNDIIQHELPAGSCLTGSRSLAELLNVSRNTVDAAYHQLAAEGYIEARKGVGFIVLPLPQMPTEGVASQATTANEKAVPSSSTTHKQAPAAKLLYDLTNSSHTSNLFPKKMWRKYSWECLERLEKEEKISTLQNGQGELFLRQQLISYLHRIRGVRCQPEQVVITSGLQQSLDCLCKLLPQKTVLLEEPGYPKAAVVFQNNHWPIKTTAIDEQGLNMQKLALTEDIGLIYTTPSHQFPTGATLPIGRRYELLQQAQQNHSFIIEDDYDSELRYYAKPIPALQSIDHCQRVIYLGTFSKALSPSLRMSYMILPSCLVASYQTKFAQYNSTVPLLNQYIVATLIAEGEYDRHVRRLNNIFKKRLAAFNQAFGQLSHKLQIIGNGSGQYFLLKFDAAVTQDTLIQAALQQGVKVYSTMEFWQEKAACPANTLFLGFSKIEISEIPDCVQRLKKAWAPWL